MDNLGCFVPQCNKKLVFPLCLSNNKDYVLCSFSKTETSGSVRQYFNIAVL